MVPQVSNVIRPARYQRRWCWCNGCELRNDCSQVKPNAFHQADNIRLFKFQTVICNSLAAKWLEIERMYICTSFNFVGTQRSSQLYHGTKSAAKIYWRCRRRIKRQRLLGFVNVVWIRWRSQDNFKTVSACMPSRIQFMHCPLSTSQGR